MVAKRSERDHAIELRKNGLSYREILEQIPVAKSTLSLWLKSVGLSKPQIIRLTEKRLAASKRGGLVKKLQRINCEKDIIDLASGDIDSISDRELWLMGICIYWAEGTKSDGRRGTSCSLDFINSDPRMIKMYVKWCLECLKIHEDDLMFSIYIHVSSNDRTNEVKKYWSGVIGLNELKFDKIYFKKHNPRTIRLRVGDSYFGSLRIKVRSSTNLNRKVKAWINLICERCGVV